MPIKKYILAVHEVAKYVRGSHSQTHVDGVFACSYVLSLWYKVSTGIQRPRNCKLGDIEAGVIEKRDAMRPPTSLSQ